MTPRRAERRAPKGTRSADLAVAWLLASMAGLVAIAGVRAGPLAVERLPGGGPWPPLPSAARGLGLTALPPTVQSLVGIGVMAFAAAAFLYALREAWRGHLPPGLVLGLAVGFLAVAAALPVLLSRDVYSYAMYGRMAALYDANPYAAVPQDFPSDPLLPFVGGVWLDTPAVYGPAFTLLASGLAAVLRDPVALVMSFKVVSGLAAVATVFVVSRAARRLAPRREAFAVALVGWNPVVIAHAVGGGHNDALVGLSVAGAVLALAGGRDTGGGEPDLDPATRERSGSPPEPPRPGVRRELAATGLLTLGALVKPSAAVVLVPGLAAVAAVRPPGCRARALAVHLGVAGGLTLAFAAPYLADGISSVVLGRLATHPGRVAPMQILLDVFGGAGSALGGHDGRYAAVVLVRAGMAMVLAGGLLVVARSVVREGPLLTIRGEGAAFGLCLLVLTLASPALLPWYLAWALPVAWLLRGVPLRVTVGLSAVLSVTHALSAPEVARATYDVVLFAGRYVVSPLLLVALGWLLLHIRRHARAGTLLEEPPWPAAVPEGEQVPASRHAR
jgi:hypothetical protein